MPKPTKVDLPGWSRLHIWQIQWVRDLLVIAGVVGLLWLGHKLSIVTVPILLALALAYLFEPLVAWVVRRRILGRPASALAIILLSTLLVVVPVVVAAGFATVQGVKFAQALTGKVDLFLRSVDAPQDEHLREALGAEAGDAWIHARDYLVEQERRRIEEQKEIERRRLREPERPGEAKEGATPAREPLDGEGATPGPSLLPQPSIAELQQPSDVYRLGRWVVEWVRDHAAEIGKRAIQGSAGAVNIAITTFGSIGTLLFSGFLTAFFFYFFCTGYGKVLEFWEGLIPEKRKGRWVSLLRQMDQVIAGFVRGRITIAAAMMLVYALGYWFAGISAWLVLGAAVGALSLVPYASSLVGVPAAMVLLALEDRAGFRGEWWWIVGSPLLVMTLAQFLDDYVLTPRIQGKTTNMDTPTILFASLAGGALAGVYGLLVAIPVAACLRILLRETFWPRFVQWSRGEARDVLPIGDGE